MVTKRIHVNSSFEDANLRLENLKNQVELEGPQASNIKITISNLEENLSNIKLQEESINNNINMLHDNLSIQQENNASLKFKAIEAQDKVTLLRDKTLPTIQELKITLFELSKMVEMYKRDNTAMAQLTREWAPKVDYFDSICASLDKKVSTMEELQNEMVKIKKNSKDLNDNVENCNEFSIKIKELEATEEHVKSQISEIYEKTSKQKKQFENKKKKAQLAYEEVQLQKMQLNQELEALILSIQRIDSENNLKNGQILNMKQSHERDVASLNAAQGKMIETIHQYHQVLKQHL